MDIRYLDLDTYEEVTTKNQAEIPAGCILLGMGDFNFQDDDMILMESTDSDLYGPACLWWEEHQVFVPGASYPIALVRNGKVLVQANSFHSPIATVANMLREKTK